MPARSVTRRRSISGAGVALGLAGLAAPVALGFGAGSAQAAPSASSAAPASRAAAPAAPAAKSCTAKAGPYQKQAERFLGLKADGKQSQKDCQAIRAFQTKNRISPNEGYAGPVTWGVMKGKEALKKSKCPTNKGRIACVDLSRQVSWIQDGKKKVYGPVPVRTGRNGYETRTGLHKIYWRHKNHTSSLYHVKMPYSQFFDGGQAFHSIPGSMYAPPGSHGCINMRPADASAFWKLLKKGDDVSIYGRKPGT